MLWNRRLTEKKRSDPDGEFNNEAGTLRVRRTLRIRHVCREDASAGDEGAWRVVFLWDSYIFPARSCSQRAACFRRNGMEKKNMTSSKRDYKVQAPHQT